MATLEVIRAGAGSGKTTELCRIVAEAVSMQLDPSRILATTFTKKAAAELKSRMQAKLLGLDGDSNKTQFGHADRFDLAAIGTVHSVAIRLLSRYAIEMGLSPTLEVLDESGSGRALNDLLGQVQEENWVRLTDAAMRLSVDDLQKQILKLLEIKRGNRISDELFGDQMQGSASRLCELLGTVSTTLSDNAGDRLLELAEQAMEEISLLSDTTKVTAEVMNKLREIRSRGTPAWSTFVKCQNLKAAKIADPKLNPIRSFAAQVRNNPCLHEDIRNFGSILAEETLRLNDQYQMFKRERGYVDYIDLEILFLELLSNGNVREQIQHDYDLVLVDEFQDTNPLQLAIFQCLRSLTQRTCWVGDPKQAIYSFRDTDPDVATPKWLEERLQEVRARDDAKTLQSTTEDAEPVEWQSPWHGNPTLAKLEGLNREILPPSVIVQQVIEALEIPVAHGGNHSDTNPLEGRSLRYWIWPFGNDSSQFKRRIKGSGLDDDALASQEGAAARVKSIEESIRLLYVGCTRAKQKLVFAHRPAKYDWLKQIADIDAILDPSLEDGEHELSGIDTTLVIRRLDAEADEHVAIADNAANWFSIAERKPRTFAKRFHSPSAVKTSDLAKVRIEDLTGPSLFPSGAKEEHYSAIGDAAHTYLGGMPSMLSLSEEYKLVVAERSIVGFGITGKIIPQMLVAAGERFSKWVTEKFPGAKWFTEVPVSGPRSIGGNWRGAIDLVLVLTDGSVVVIDHKSAPIRRVHCEAKAQSYTGQLQAYEEVLTGQGETVSASFIHFPFAGTVVELMR